MKITHIITRLIVGGAQENTLLTCAGQARLGHEVTLVTGPSEGPEGSLIGRATGQGYRVIETPWLIRAPHPVYDAKACWHLRRLLSHLQPDVVHTHSSKAGILGRAAAWDEKTPRIVHTIHGLPFHPYQNGAVNLAWILLERWAARRCHAIITVADAMTRQALAAGIGEKSRFTTVYSGMDVDPFLDPGVTSADVRRRLRIPADRLVFATIARLQPLKGHDDLLAIAARLFARVPEAHFLWIGDGAFRKRFEAAIAAAGWQSRFTLTGLIPPAQVPLVLPAADVLIHPSYREGLARALPQGLLAGKPVISYDCDGAAEVCIPGQTGLLARTGDADGLLRAALWMAGHPAERLQMAATGKALCLQRFPTEVMVQNIQRVYDGILLSG